MSSVAKEALAAGLRARMIEHGLGELCVCVDPEYGGDIRSPGEVRVKYPDGTWSANKVCRGCDGRGVKLTPLARTILELVTVELLAPAVHRIVATEIPAAEDRAVERALGDVHEHEEVLRFDELPQHRHRLGASKSGTGGIIP